MQKKNKVQTTHTSIIVNQLEMAKKYINKYAKKKYQKEKNGSILCYKVRKLLHIRWNSDKVTFKLSPV